MNPEEVLSAAVLRLNVCEDSGVKWPPLRSFKAWLRKRNEDKHFKRKI